MIELKGIYAHHPAIVHLLILLAFVMIGAIFSSLLSTGLVFVLYGTTEDMTQDADLMRMVQLLSAIGTFLLPALATAWLCGEHPKDYLSIRQLPDGRAWVLTFACMFLAVPIMNLLGYLNQQMTLPGFLAPIEEWMRSQEDLAEELTKCMLSEDGLGAFLMNLVVIAIAAAITEEFLFRGAVQRIIEQWDVRPQAAIWVAAILFSAFHLQFYGFFPRMLLGAYFGYLLCWSRSIWLPVFAHFLNNAFAVIAMSDSRIKDNAFVSGEITDELLSTYALIALLAMILFWLVNGRMRRILRG